MGYGRTRWASAWQGSSLMDFGSLLPVAYTDEIEIPEQLRRGRVFV